MRPTMGLQQPFNLFQLLVLLYVASNKAESQELVAELSSARLLTPRKFTSASFDGNDSIYIFGGANRNSAPLSGIQKYAISTDTIKVVADLPYSNFGASVSSDTQGNFYYIGGYYANYIFKFTPSTGQVEQVGSFPNGNDFSAAVKYNDLVDSVVILGGKRDQKAIVHFDPNTNVSIRVGDFQEGYWNIAAVSDGKGTAYAFGNPIPFDTSLKHSVAVINLTTYEVSYGPKSMVSMLDTPEAVWDGRFAYILSGFVNITQDIPDYGIIRFDPETMEYTFLPVTNYPGSRFYGASAVYVKRLDRIYIFGGQSANLGYHDQIWFIDLHPIKFACVDKNDGAYPHPYDCAMWIQCLDEVVTEYKCPEPLLFDPDMLVCNDPDLVDCDNRNHERVEM